MNHSLEDIKKKIELVQKKHDNDLDLMGHKIGSDPYCLYCEQYKKLLRKEKALKKIKHTDTSTFKKVELEPAVETTYQPKQKELFEVSLKSGDKYLVFALDIEQVADLLQVPGYSIVKHAEVPRKYWHGLYIETKHGTLTTVDKLIKNSRSRIVSKFSLSNNSDVRHYCFNDTPFEFIVYDANRFDLLEKFVGEYVITKTKKFKTNGRVTIALPTGAIGVSAGDVLLKITEKVIVAIDKEDFEENFSEQENLVWTTI